MLSMVSVPITTPSISNWTPVTSPTDSATIVIVPSTTEPAAGSVIVSSAGGTTTLSTVTSMLSVTRGVVDRLDRHRVRTVGRSRGVPRPGSSRRGD